MSNLPPPPPPSQIPGNTSPSSQKNGRQPRKNPFGVKRNNSDPSAPKSEKQQLPKWAVWLIAACALALIFGPRFLPTKNSEKLTYTEFLSQVRLGKVDKVSINNTTNVLSGTLSDGRKFSTTGAPLLSDADEKLLKDQGVDYNYHTPQAHWFTSLIPILLPFFLVVRNVQV
jgi:hypothetical protein